ncbi:hypothetical protein A4X06_0g8115 [Tilletia controversa]|uniref:YMC020W-like alpha/beta hydrolase domain-containing protein n=1 Tax=Tilletia controversa TaxID=13291 RepID=A0A8X7ML96_9BASI|nr:hypothetical protein CF328_g7550 [Tilletia controversa]KAE8239670.1 hypothetical protein A4X06_0g8115 [Tilletia controversa]
MTRASSSRRRDSSTSAATITPTTTTPGSSALTIPASPSASSRLNAAGAGAGTRSSRDSIYSLSLSSRRHLTPLANPAPSTSTTSLSPSHARSSGTVTSTATSRLRNVASNASNRLGLPRLATDSGFSVSTSPPKATAVSPPPAPPASGPSGGTSVPASSAADGTKRAGTDSEPTAPAPPSVQPLPDTQAQDRVATAEAGAAAMKRKIPPGATLSAAEAGNSRRRTWFGFGSPMTAEPTSINPIGETPSTPLPMDADEAAFRLALVAGAPTQPAAAEGAAAQPAEGPKAALSPETTGATAKIQAEPQTEEVADGQSTAASSITEQVPTNPRTTNSRGWFTWRAQAQAPPPPPGSPLLPAEASQTITPKAVQQLAPAPAQAPPQPPTLTAPAPSKSSQPAYASPLRRMWNRSEQAADAPTEPETQSAPTASPVKAAMEQQAPPAPATEQHAPDGSGDRSGQPNAAGSSTWRFSLWAGRAPVDPQMNQGPAEDVKPNVVSSAGNSDIPSIVLNKEVTNHAEHESQAGASDPSTLGQASYASYITNWIPGWSSEIPQASSSSTLSQDATDGPGGASFVPRTPAEQVKADALARSERPRVLDTVSGSIQKLASPTEAILNSQTRKSWVSYFTTRNPHAIRRIQGTPASDGGPEVMDLDEDEPAESSTAPSLAESAPAVMKGGMGKGAAAAKAIVQKASAVTSAASSVVLKGGAKSGSKSASGSAPTSPVIGPTSKGGSPTKDGSTVASTPGRRGSSDPKGKGSAATTVRTQESTVSLSNKATATAQELTVPTPDNKAATNSKLSKKGSVVVLKAPNLVLPSFEDTFATAPRIWPPKVGMLERTIQAFNTYLFNKPPDFQRLGAPTATSASASQGTGKARRRSSTLFTEETAQRLPRSWEVMGDKTRASQRGVGSVRKVVVLGIRGWFAQFAILKNVMGEPTGTSFKFATMMTEAIRKHFKEAGWELNPEAITVIALEGDGRVADRVHDLSVNLLSNPAWVKDLHEADAIFFSAHSQGSIVGTELLARLIEQKHIQPERTRVCLLAMAGIHEGPFPHLQSAIMSAYFTYFETAAAKELFEFMASTAHVSESYAAALRICLSTGVKAVYVASVDDQVVPLHGALHAAISHPSILRALYIDGTAFPRADFLTNLLVLCTQVRNAGLNDHEVLSLLSTTVAGSLYGGVGHSNVYEEPQVYDLAVRYLFETTHPCSEPTCVGDHRVSMPAVDRRIFQVQAHNPYSLPWAIRGLLEDPDVRELFSEHMADLLEQFAQWKPTTKSQKDVHFRLSPLKSIQIPGVRQRTASTASSSMPPSPKFPSSSKL